MSKKNKKNNHKQNTDNSNEQEYIKDTSPIVYQKGKLKSELHIRVRPDLTDKQKELLKLINDKECKMIFIRGSAGSSKTFCAIMAALQLLNEKKVSDLIYLRSIVESSDSHLGYLKGDIDQKVSVYLQALTDKLEELLPNNEIDMLLKEGRITGQPINFLRGINWNAKVIVADEIQNMTFKEITTLITRVGQFSKLFMLFDDSQSDIKNSGALQMMNKFNDEESRNNGIYTFEFNDDDIVRSELVKFIIKRLNKK
jgi:phosphate starvation-inducible PhoH-like protein